MDKTLLIQSLIYILNYNCLNLIILLSKFQNNNKLNNNYIVNINFEREFSHIY